MTQSVTPNNSIMIVAGEASGDLHGSKLVNAMIDKDPTLAFFGMGGVALEEAGVEMICRSDNISVMGITEILSKISDILSSLKQLKRALKERKPSLLILIDFADFNLRLAKTAKRFDIPVFYYITPKVWVWRKRRVKKLARLTDSAGVILPFEENYLKNRGVNAKYVGNPVADSVEATVDRSTFCLKNMVDPEKALVGILPGSRKKEVKFLLPVFLEAARRMQKKYSREVAFLIPLAPALTNDDLLECGMAEFQDDLEIHVIRQDRYNLMASCDAVVAASGTVTLELALLDVPMVVAYKFTPISYLIGKILVHIPYFSLVNILAEKEVVTELLQEQVTPGSVELELARILFDENVSKQMKDDLQAIKMKMGEKGASIKAAELAFATMRKQ